MFSFRPLIGGTSGTEPVALTTMAGLNCLILSTVASVLWNIYRFFSLAALASRYFGNQKQLKESMEDAHRANLSKTAFLRRMSHDIRTPLNGIVGMIHIAEKYNNDVVKLRECRKKVLQSADYLQNLINNVLDISKLESGSLVLEHKSFDLAELLRNNLTVVAMSAYENGVRFEGGAICMGKNTD